MDTYATDSHGILICMRSGKIIVCGGIFILLFLSFFAAQNLSKRAHAATNINSFPSSSAAWDDESGWWNFYSSQTVMVHGTVLQGYASSTVGDISLDCATAEGGSVCASSNYGICNGYDATHNADGTCSNGDATGNLSGFAWNDTIGWISFCGGRGTTQCPGSQPYGVTIDSNGDFHGYAWSDMDGWISFNCANNSSCASNQYLVNTSWRATSTVGYLTSEIFDTGVQDGATLSSIIWQGNQGSGIGICTAFQIAASNATSGPWNFLGPDNTNSTYYGAACSQSPNGGTGCAPANTPICVSSPNFNNFRYYRYRVQLTSDKLQTNSPRVDNVILNFNQ